MGKRAYARRLYKDFDFVYDLERNDPEDIKAPGLIVNLHAGVKSLLKRNINALEFFEAKIEILKNSVIIGDEISGGVVPLDEFERLWRDQTGKLYQFLAAEADIVDRIFAGLPIRLKG
ncbi:MAG: bifunctional adenosylcobinamide kinase/adenosylcobinamide-phosphate guanylyltransferase [Synergistaceae bacterium]|nr:bifunctional adenosylcobinamide kinase/adenosylcobinamide-phosphate guanylyltransferase [Synergistaceae bacterium]